MLNYHDIIESPLLDEKLEAIQQIFVQHTKAQEAREMLQLSLRFARRAREISSTYLIGWSRCGKSEIIKRLLQEQTGISVSKDRVQLLQGKGKRYLYADLTGGATPRTLARKINDTIFNDRKSLSLGEDEGTDALIDNLNDHNVDGFFMDEAQNLADDKKGIKKLGRFILSAENHCNAPLFIVGAPSLLDTRRAIEATRQRSGGLKKLEPFGFVGGQKDFLSAFVAAFSEQLPFPSNWFSQNEDDHDMLRATFYAQRGRPGRHSLLVEAATVHAFIRTGGAEPEELTKEDIAAGFDRVFLDEDAMLGLNPFRKEDYKKLPAFPLNVEQEERENLRLEL
jgi:hypothetical protein